MLPRDIVQQLHECTQANTPSIEQTMQNGSNYFKDGHLMPPERPRIDVPSSLVICSKGTNIVATAVTLMCAWTLVCTGVRAAAGCWKLSVISSSVD